MLAKIVAKLRVNFISIKKRGNLHESKNCYFKFAYYMKKKLSGFPPKVPPKILPGVRIRVRFIVLSGISQSFLLRLHQKFLLGTFQDLNLEFLAGFYQKLLPGLL